MESNRRKALIIVDVQNDFIEGGALGVNGGKIACENIVSLLEDEEAMADIDYVITTQDWHINPGDHFSENPDFIDSWPVHCVAEEYGSEIAEPLVTALEKRKVNAVIKKGEYTAAYSGFEGHDKDRASLRSNLRGFGVTDVILVGIATDYCVAETALHAAEYGYKTTILTDYCATINEEKLEELKVTKFKDRGIIVRKNFNDFDNNEGK